MLPAEDCDAPKVQGDESEAGPLAIQPEDDEIAETETGRTLAVERAEEESLAVAVTVIALGMGESVVMEAVTRPLTVSGRGGLARVAVVTFPRAVVEQLVSRGAEVASCTAVLEQVDSGMMSL